MGAGERQVLPDEIDQQLIWFDLLLNPHAIDFERKLVRHTVCLLVVASHR
jgi:hypothetical protein